MATASTSPRQVKLRRCSILSPTLHLRAPVAQRAQIQQQGIDISRSVVSIDIYESIFQNTIAGSIQIRETHGYPEYFPLTGAEFVLLEFVTDYLGKEQTFKRLFRIRRVGDATFPKNEERVYTIDLVTPEFFKSLSSRVLKRYNDTTCVDAVKDLMKNYLDVPDVKMASTNFEETSGKLSAVIPNYTPLQAINFFTMLSLTKTTPSESNFLFFETLDGFYFTSVKKLILDAQQTANTDLPIFSVNANKLTGAEKIDERDAYNSIIGLHQEQTFDVLVDATTGMLRTKMLHLDFVARKWNEEDSRYTESFGKTTHLDKYPVYPDNFDQSIGRNVKMFIVPTNVATANSTYVANTGDVPSPQRLYESIVLRNRQLRELQHLRTVLDVPGQPQLRAGKVIILNYPSSRAIQGATDNPSATAVQTATPYHSGRHLITSVRHSMTQVSLGVMEYRMHIEAVRDSFGAPLIGYEKDAKDVDGKAV
jgi:hypothetical protein